MPDRSRTLPLFYGTGYRTAGYGETRVFKAEGLQSTSDINHPYWHYFRRKGIKNFDIGDSFYSRKPYWEGGDNRVHVRCFGLEYIGPAWCPGLPMVFNEANFANFEGTYAFASAVTQMLADGARGISSAAPTNPASDLATALGELRSEGLPKLTGATFLSGVKSGQGPSRAVRDASSEHLNYQFGVKPFINDLKSFTKTTASLEKLISDFQRNSGKLIRRRREFPETQSVLVDNTFSSPPVELTSPWLWTGPLASYGTTARKVTRTSKTWFSGAFTYHVPEGDRMVDQIRRAEASLHRAYGSVSLSTAWNLLPWSWAADWMANMGDVINNVSLLSRDGLVMRHGYVMRTDHIRMELVHQGLKFGSGTTVYQAYPGINRMAYGVVTKRRQKATPYGFGLNTEAFTLRQKSIIAALGLQAGFRR